MWHLVNDKAITLPGCSKTILVFDGENYSLVNVENFLRYVDKPYSRWTHWMEIPSIKSFSDEAIQDLACFCVADDIENGIMEKDLGSFYPHDDQSWIQGYQRGFFRGFKEAIE